MPSPASPPILQIAVLPGDGIGPEVIDATVPLLEQLSRNAPYAFRFASHPAGAQHYKATGVALPPATLAAAREADATLFGAMGWPEIRYPDGTEIAPQLDLRVELELYAGVRPARAIPGIALPLADPRAAAIDLVVIRESTEGLFASRGKGVVIDDREARDTMVITRWEPPYRVDVTHTGKVVQGTGTMEVVALPHVGG